MNITNKTTYRHSAEPQIVQKSNCFQLSVRKLRRGSLLVLAGAVVLLFPPAAAAVIIDGSTITLQAADQTPDNTALIQGCLDNPAYTRINIQPGTNVASWMTGPLVITRDNTEIHLEANTILETKPGSYPKNGDCIITANGRSNIKITGQSPAASQILAHKLEYSILPVSEYRHALNLNGCSNMTVSSLTLAQTGGDGIYIGAGAKGYCSNVTISDVVTDGCGRNGLSVISVDGMTVTRSTFKNTKRLGNVAINGPWGGIDLEPNRPTDRLINITIDSCKLLNNYKGLAFLPTKLEGSTGVVTVTFKNCLISGNENWGFKSYSIVGPFDPKSAFIMQDCTIANNGGLGICIVNKGKGALPMTFQKCTLRNNGMDRTDCDSSIAISTDKDTKNPGGNIFFKNVTVEQSPKLPYCLSVAGIPTCHIDGVHGDITAITGTLKTQDADNVDVKIVNSSGRVPEINAN